MKNYLPLLTNTLPTYVIALIIAGAIILLAAIILIIVFALKKKRKPKVNSDVWIEALGGKDNIVSVTAVGSRINLTLKDKQLINRDKLTEYGVKSVLVMSNKVTLVKEKAVDTAQAINEALQ